MEAVLEKPAVRALYADVDDVDGEPMTLEELFAEWDRILDEIKPYYEKNRRA